MIKNKKNIFLCAILVLLSSSTFITEIDRDLKLYNYVVKNIVSYTIYNQINGNFKSYLKYGLSQYFDHEHIIPDKDFAYNIKFNRFNTEKNYFANYDLMRFSCPRMGRYTIEKKDTVFVFPVNTSYYTPLMDEGIIAVSRVNNTVLYISGFYFLDDIRPFFFKENRINKTDLKEYVSIRYYNYAPELIDTFEKNRIWHIYFNVSTR